jgi:amidase
LKELSSVDAVGQAELVRRGSVSALELVEAAIARIEAVNPVLNALVTPLYEKARREAMSVDPSLPLAGVPYVLKDHFTASACDPLSEGTRVLKDLRWAPDHDSHYVTKMRAAGCVLIGKTNLSEFALRATTEPAAWGPCRNPWDTTRSPGGSSGGSGAAVAAGMVPIGHATDAGGSIRIPAGLNGAVGLKPSRGRISQGPDFGDVWANGAWCLGAITRSVRDAAAALDAVSGYMPGDPYTAPPPQAPYLNEVGVLPGRLRVGFLARAAEGFPAIDAEVADGVKATAALLEELGHDVVEAHPDDLDRQMDDALTGFMGIAGSGVGWILNYWSKAIGRTIRQNDVEPATWAMMSLGEHFTGRAFLDAVESTAAFTRRIVAWWNEFDLLLTPTTAVPAFELGALDADDPVEGLRRSSAVTGGFTVPFNITGQPAVSLPLHWTSAGLPAGMQFVAAYGREDLLIRVASQLEAARPWTDRKPPLRA